MPLIVNISVYNICVDYVATLLNASKKKRTL